MELRYERACLLLYHEGKYAGSVPLTQLERIVMAPHVALSAGVLGLIAEKDVALLVVNHRFPERSAQLSAVVKGDVQRRIRQYQLYQDESFRLHWAIRLVRLKTVRQYQTLLYFRRQRPDLRYPLTRASRQLQRLLADLKDQAVDSLALVQHK